MQICKQKSIIANLQTKISWNKKLNLQIIKFSEKGLQKEKNE